MRQDRAVRGMRRLALGVLLGCLLTLGAPWSVASAQQRDTTRAAQDTTRAFVRGGIYDKPFLTRLGGRTIIGGYAEAHARWERVEGVRDDAGFEAKRFNIFTNTRVSDFVRIGAELEFEGGGEEIKVEYAAIDFLIHPSLAFRGGMVLSPLGRFNLSHDSPLNEFTDRPLVAVDLLGVALSEPGFGVFGQFGFARTARLTYEIYATNGFHDGLITSSEAGTRVPLGRGNFEDNNGSPALVARLTLSPRVQYEAGVSLHHGAYNAYNEEGTLVDERRDLTIAAVDAEARIAGVQLSGEAAIVSIDVPPGLTRIYAARQRGLYVDAILPFGRGWVSTMPESSFALKARYDYVDFDAQRIGQGVAQASLGLNFRPTPDSVLKLDYVRGRGRDEFNNLAQHAFLLLSLATYF
jgi:hypothetical protein